MTKSNFRKLSIANLILGYLVCFLFIWLIALNIQNKESIILVKEDDSIKTELTTIDSAETKERGIIYDTSHRTIVRDHDVAYVDRLHGATVDRGTKGITYDDSRIIDRGTRHNVAVGGDLDYEISESIRDRRLSNLGLRHHGGVRDLRTRSSVSDKPYIENDIDIGLLDRRLASLGSDALIDDSRPNIDTSINERPESIGVNKKDNEFDLSKITLSKDDDEGELGDINSDFGESRTNYGVGKGGQLYAYDFPSRGVGAGIGSSSVGAGAGGGAGLSAGIGEGMLNGETVPTLGGVGTGPAPLAGQAAGSPASGGVGGLVGGAGAGGAAGLMHGVVTEKLGLGAGCAEHGGNCDGHHGHASHNYDHLPKDGALHIMMHVDGSGSILNTRKQLEVMKNTLLKDALLPYYNNDETLYNRRVTIMDGNGERTLQFFTEAAKKDNVLALVFQDEAQPAYHLPTFNKKPQDDYSKDLKSLKGGLNGHGGLYRGIMFQVDRGRTFAKSFKEFVESAWQGTGYLESSNLKKYHWRENKRNIESKDGIVFSDEYHAKDSGDPQYYLDLIMNASKKVGLDLNIYGGGLKDGKEAQKLAKD